MAFLWAIKQEMIGARRSLKDVSDQIASLAVPSDDFLFDRALHEGMLFEDESYTNTRMYFWALQSLRTVNDCIASMISAWENYQWSSLTEFIRGSEEQARSGTVSDRLMVEASIAGSVRDYRRQVDEEVKKLAELIKANNTKQEEIRSLRDGVFNASSVLEARTTISQGKNIQLLTYLSLVFLPASFVTSVFSMGSILPQTINTKSFAITFSLVCGATYTIILLVASGGVSKVVNRVRRRQARATTDNIPAGEHPLRRRKRSVGSEA